MLGGSQPAAQTCPEDCGVFAARNTEEAFWLQMLEVFQRTLAFINAFAFVLMLLLTAVNHHSSHLRALQGNGLIIVSTLSIKKLVKSPSASEMLYCKSKNTVDGKLHT